MFAEKARNIQNAGAIGGIVIGEWSSMSLYWVEEMIGAFSFYFLKILSKDVQVIYILTT